MPVGILEVKKAHPFSQTVYFDDFQATPTTGQILIQLLPEGTYWDGTQFVATETWLSTTVDSTKKLHSYTWTPPQGTEDKSVSVLMRINGDTATVDGDTFFIRPPRGSYKPAARHG